METVYHSYVAKVLASEDQMTYKVVSLDKSFRAKTFKGEMAWADAARYLSDNTGEYASL